ncbi:MAG: DUF2442 domain-containing protein [Methylobacter sp.]
MKLKHFEHCDGYLFLLTFENGEVKGADLTDLIGQYVSLDTLNTARIDPEWGCLEFNEGKVDIEPKTLYRYVMGGRYQEVA